MSKPWSVAAAKAKLSEVIDKALAGEPQIITRKGKKAVMVVSIEQWDTREKRKGSLVDFFLNSAAREEGPLEAERFPGPMRKVELG